MTGLWKPFSVVLCNAGVFSEIRGMRSSDRKKKTIIDRSNVDVDEKDMALGRAHNPSRS